MFFFLPPNTFLIASFVSVWLAALVLLRVRRRSCASPGKPSSRLDVSIRAVALKGKYTPH